MLYRSLRTAKIPALPSYSASFSRVFSSLVPSPELAVSESPKLNQDLQNSSVPILDSRGRVCHYIYSLLCILLQIKMRRVVFIVSYIHIVERVSEMKKKKTFFSKLRPMALVDGSVQWLEFG